MGAVLPARIDIVDTIIVMMVICKRYDVRGEWRGGHRLDGYGLVKGHIKSHQITVLLLDLAL
jgi:hypothetical protein